MESGSKAAAVHSKDKAVRGTNLGNLGSGEETPLCTLAMEASVSH